MHQRTETRVCIFSGLASFGHLGIIRDPLIVSKFHKETHYPKGQENKIYTTRGIWKVLNMVFYLINRFTNPIIFGIILTSYFFSIL